MLYTREEMINLLMLYEEDFANDHRGHEESHLSGKTVEQWIEESFKLYNNMNDDDLLYQHMTLLEGLYEEGEQEHMAMISRKRLESEKDRLWIKWWQQYGITVHQKYDGELYHIHKIRIGDGADEDNSIRFMG